MSASEPVEVLLSDLQDSEPVGFHPDLGTVRSILQRGQENKVPTWVPADGGRIVSVEAQLKANRDQWEKAVTGVDKEAKKSGWF